jgi:hypothetical protein
MKATWLEYCEMWADYPVVAILFTVILLVVVGMCISVARSIIKGFRK